MQIPIVKISDLGLVNKKKLANGTGIYIIKKNSKILKIFKEILSSIDFKNKYRFKIIKIGSKDARVFNKENKKSKNIGYFKKIELFPWNKQNINFFIKLKDLFLFKERFDHLHHKNCNLKNEILDNKFYNKSAYCKIQVTLYPKNYGYFSKHDDGKSNKMLISTSLYKRNKSSKVKKSLLFYPNNSEAIAPETFKFGDIVIYNLCIPHEVKKNNVDRISIILAKSLLGKKSKKIKWKKK